MFTPAVSSLVSRFSSGASGALEEVVEVSACWQDTVLSVVHVPWGQPLVVADQSTVPRQRGASSTRVLALPAEATGQTTWSLLKFDGGTPSLLCRRGMRVWERSEQETEQPMEIEFEPAHHWARVPLRPGRALRVELPQVELLVRRTPAAALPTVVRGGTFQAAPLLSFLGCATVFGMLFASSAYFSPPFHLRDDESLAHERFLAISQYLESASEKDRRREEEKTPAADQATGDPGQAAERAAGREGALGKPSARKAEGRVAVHGPRDTPTLTLAARREMLEEATTGGLIGMLRASHVAAGPLSPFGADRELGSDPRSAQGAMFAATIDDAIGGGGLGRLGEGFGGGSLFGKGIGRSLSGPATIGGGTGETGFGSDRGLSGGTHVVRSPSVHPAGITQLSGRLPPQTVQRVIRQNFGRFRLCYEQGLGRNPNLAGRVSVRFLIGGDGAVSSASGSGDLADADVVSCVTSAFYGLSFPAPEGGTVKVTYPLMFTPG